MLSFCVNGARKVLKLDEDSSSAADFRVSGSRLLFQLGDLRKVVRQQLLFQLQHPSFDLAVG